VVVSPLFRRNSQPTAPVPDDEPEADSADGSLAGKAYTAKKGRPTPKRSAAEGRRAAEPAPKDSKEARKRMRKKMADERSERWEAAKRGDESAMMARDRGPVRRLVRDIIDSRRNVGPFFFGAVVVVIVLTTVFGKRPAVILGTTLGFYALFLVLLLDIFLIYRTIRKAVASRFPDSKERMASLIMYAAMRSISFRKLRNPSPRVKPGDTV
jgi:hypothetical protein